MIAPPNSLDHHWMPFTANRDFKADPRLMVRAEGAYYWNHRGERVLDGCSGLFCCGAGHGRREIAEAVAAQLQDLDYAAPFQLGHPASFELARKVATLTPPGLDRVFFTNSGSEAVDTAMKVALAYHRSRGEATRVGFVSRERAYHGVNMGGTALSGMMSNREAFGAALPQVSHLRHTWLPEHRFIKGQPGEGAELAEDLQRIVGLHGARNIAACFIEPIAGSTGVLVPPVGYLERLRELCDAHGILLVFDEVICGFGRTGRPFAADSFGVRPDLMTLAKGLTNGSQPMGAVVARGEIYASIVDAAADPGIELFHGYTYSGHPAACAAGLATLDIYEQEELFARSARLSGHFLDGVFSLSELPSITDIRGYGMLAAFDLAPAARAGERGYAVQKRLFQRGLHVKFTGDTGLVAPPFIVEEEHLDEICGILREVLSEFEGPR